MPQNTQQNLTLEQEQSLLATIPPEIKGFLQGILMDGGLTDVDPDIMDEMIVQLYTRFDKFLIGEIAEYMPEEKLEEFAQLVEKNPTGEQVRDYLLKNLPNAQDVFTVAFAKFRELYLEGTEKEENAKDEKPQEEKPQE